MDLQSVSFSGKTGIITGGAQGIGKAIARQFVDMGGKAVIVDINPETAARTCGMAPFVWDNGAEGTGNEKHAYIDHGTGEYSSEPARKAVETMVKVLLPGAKPVNNDASDALAIAICHNNFRHSRNINRK